MIVHVGLRFVKKAKIFGTLFVLISVTFGALNTHYLKSILPKIALDSIDVSLRYMMYHGLGLLIISILPIKEKRYIINLFIIGTLLFSLRKNINSIIKLLIILILVTFTLNLILPIATFFENINVDLMYALPDQSIQDAMDDIETVFYFPIKHLSWYRLLRFQKQL